MIIIFSLLLDPEARCVSYNYHIPMTAPSLSDVMVMSGSCVAMKTCRIIFAKLRGRCHGPSDLCFGANAVTTP